MTNLCTRVTSTPCTIDSVIPKAYDLKHMVTTRRQMAPGKPISSKT